MISRLKLPLSLVLVISLASCGGGSWNASQKQRAIPARVDRGTLAKDYYGPPQMMSNASAGKTGFILGATTGLVGGLVGGAVVAGMQNNYEKKNLAQFAQIKSNVNAVDTGGLVQLALQQRLETIPHFRGQVKPGAAAYFSVEVKKVIFQRLPGKSPDHTPSMLVRITETAADGEKLYDGTLMADGAGSDGQAAHAPLAEYAAKPELIRAHINAVAGNLAQKCCEVLAEKLEE